LDNDEFCYLDSAGDENHHLTAEAAEETPGDGAALMFLGARMALLIALKLSDEGMSGGATSDAVMVG
jgi:hypothetical protein